jgi:NAD(P)-dependent dehydrogenase (short-subunit alcohol dehydrogenase family)
MDFKNKVVIVTGGAKGIGRGIVSAYAEKGAKVLIADVDEVEGKQTELVLKQSGKDVLYVKTDVRNESDIVNLMVKAKDAWGRVDILINNAGKGLFKSLYDVTVEEWDDIIQTNL